MIRSANEFTTETRAGITITTEDRVIDCEPPPYGGQTGRYYLLDRVYVAGFPYYLGPKALGHIRPGDRLHLAAEPSNPHDRYAVEVSYGPCKLGYIPRSDNRHISRLLRQGARLYCIAIEVNPDSSPWQALRIAIYLETEMNLRSDICPKCGGRSIARILWGMPAWSEELQRDMDAGKIVLGGCCVTDNDPEWHCNGCDHEWRTSPPETGAGS